jgi:hypothetical protein
MDEQVGSTMPDNSPRTMSIRLPATAAPGLLATPSSAFRISTLR